MIPFLDLDTYYKQVSDSDDDLLKAHAETGSSWKKSKNSVAAEESLEKKRQSMFRRTLARLSPKNSGASSQNSNAVSNMNMIGTTPGSTSNDHSSVEQVNYASDDFQSLRKESDFGILRIKSTVSSVGEFLAAPLSSMAAAFGQILRKVSNPPGSKKKNTKQGGKSTKQLLPPTHGNSNSEYTGDITRTTGTKMAVEKEPAASAAVVTQQDEGVVLEKRAPGKNHHNSDTTCATGSPIVDLQEVVKDEVVNQATEDKNNSSASTTFVGSPRSSPLEKAQAHQQNKNALSPRGAPILPDPTAGVDPTTSNKSQNKSIKSSRGVGKKSKEPVANKQTSNNSLDVPAPEKASSKLRREDETSEEKKEKEDGIFSSTKMNNQTASKSTMSYVEDGISRTSTSATLVRQITVETEDSIPQSVCTCKFYSLM